MRKIGTGIAIVLALALLLSSSGVRATPLNGTLMGRVTNGSGGGIGGVTIYVANGIQATTDGNGNYSQSNIPAGGGYNIVAFAVSGNGYANAHQYSVVINNGSTTTLNFTLSSSVATLTGYVYDAQTQARIMGVALILDSDIHDGWSNTAQATGSNGVYNLDRIAAGRSYYLHAFPPSPYTPVILQLTVNPGNNNYNVPLSTSTSGIHGHLALPGGGNAAGAGVFIGSGDGGSGTCSTNTDSSGNYSCSLPPDNYYVHALEFNGYPGLLTNVQLSSGFITVNFALNNGPATISGQARDFNLNPINGANVQAFEHTAPYGHFRSIFVGGNGAYNFTGMGNQGSYLLGGAAAGYATVSDDNVAMPGNNSLSFNFKLGHFSDVQAQDPNSVVEFPFYYVEYLKSVGVAHGFPDGTFGPLTNVKRGEYAQLLVAAMGWPIDTSGGPHFSDVPTSYVFYGAIETAKNRGAISGYPDGTYRPNSNVSRGEATKISVAVSGWSLLNPPTASYNDVPTNHWAYQFIETALSHGANANDGGGYFRPNAAATRAETAKLLCVANAAGCQ